MTGKQRALDRIIISGAVILAPVFFVVLYLTVTALVRPSFGFWAWTVPVATEGCFVLLYLLDIRLALAGKPMGWLRLTPYPFAGASLFLNVYASRGSIPGMVGHAAVTVAFFLPLIVAEAAVRRMAVSEEDAALAREMADARRYALDLVRDRKGVLWRLRVPSLLRVQILRARPPAAVSEAVSDGARFGGAAKWEGPVETGVIRGLTRGDKVAAEVKREKRVIEQSVTASDEARTDGPVKRQPPARKPVSARAVKHAKVRTLLTAGELTREEIARKVQVSVSTVDRIKREMPTPLRPRSAEAK